jgi:hypothetical protein
MIRIHPDGESRFQISEGRFFQKRQTIPLQELSDCLNPSSPECELLTVKFSD